MEHEHARQAELGAQALYRRCDRAEVLRDQRHVAELVAYRVEQLAAGSAAPDALARRPVPGFDGPVGDEAAEVVDSRRVDELERAPKAFDPPAVAGGALDVPVVERVAPQLAARAPVVGRHPRDDALLEELRPPLMVGPAGRHVDRQVADQPHAARTRIRAQRSPLALEADLRRERALARERRPRTRPERVPRHEALDLFARNVRVRLCEEA